MGVYKAGAEVIEQGIKHAAKNLPSPAKFLPFLEWKGGIKKRGKWPKGLPPQHESLLERQYNVTEGSDAAGMQNMLEGMTAPENSDIRLQADGQASEYFQNLGGFYEKQDQGDALSRQFRASGKGVRAEKQAVGREIGQRLIEQPDFEPRQDLFNIMDHTGDRKRISGTDKVLAHYQETGEIDPSLFVYQSKKTNKASQQSRAKLMRVPKEEATAEFHRRFPNDPERAEKMAKVYNKTRMSGYHRTADFARKNGLTVRELLEELRTGNKKILSQAEKNKRTTYASGHGVSVKAEKNPLYKIPEGTDPNSPLLNPSTSGESTWIEEAIENIVGGNKVEHDINPFVAKKIGMPFNWLEDIDIFIDRYTSNSPHQLPMWQRDFSLDELDALTAIPGNASEEEVEKVFLALMDARRNPKSNRNNFIQELMAIQRDVNRSKGGRDVVTGKTDVAPPNVSEMMERGLERP